MRSLAGREVGLTKGKTEIPPNKLLEAIHGERLDTGAAGTAGRADQEVATVGEIDGSQVSGGKG